MKQSILDKINLIKEILGYASYDINPAGSLTAWMMGGIQAEVTSDIKDLQRMVDELEAELAADLYRYEGNFFEGIKQQYGIDVPQKDRLSFLISAGREIYDLRWVHRMHPDQQMVETSCLHFLGDDAQIWWENRKRNNKTE